MATVAVGSMVAEVTGEGFPVVMIHGLGGTLNMFQPQMAALGSYRVVRLDLPGAGRSPGPHGAITMESLGGAVAQACAALGVQRAHFVGHSMGTMICQAIAADTPAVVASLTLFGALAEPAEATRNGLQARAGLARSGGMTDIADTIVANALSAHTRENSPGTVAFVRECLTRQDPESYARHCEALSKATAVDARRISAPTLLLTGDADAVNPPGVAQALADRIKGAVFSNISRCGHWTPVESPRDCNDKVTDFLRRAER